MWYSDYNHRMEIRENIHTDKHIYLPPVKILINRNIIYIYIHNPALQKKL